MKGIDAYVSATDYYPWGGVHERILGSGAKRVQLRTTIDQATKRLTENRASTQDPINPNSWLPQLVEKYGYDAAGNVTSINEVTSADVTVSNQCFRYDGLRQLTEAWTTTAASCQATPAQSTVGGPDPYWTSYRYDRAGNRTSDTAHKPTGATTRTYTYPAAGQPHTLRTVTATGAAPGTDSYGYDPIGNTTTRALAGKPSQNLDWDAEGHLASVTDSGGTTSYIYDADGQRLLAIEPTGTTLYLGNTEIRRTTTGLTWTRYYASGTTTVATRSSTAGLTWQANDHHNTGQLTIKAGDLGTTRRKTDPFGNPRGAQPSWPTNRGFVNGTNDPTGLTHLGAREYEPTTGRFISIDPVFDSANPQQFSGYTYGGANPATNSDPDGRCYGRENGDLCPGNTSGPWAPKDDGARARRFNRNPHSCPNWNNVTGCRPNRPAPEPPRCSAMTPEYCHAPGTHNLTAYDIAYKEWLPGVLKGLHPDEYCYSSFREACAEYYYFTKNDALWWELVRLSDNYVGVLLRIEALIGKGFEEGTAHFHYSAMPTAEVLRHLGNDSLSIATRGFAGSPRVDSVLGSYDVDWRIVGNDAKGNPVVEIHVQNATTVSSAIPIPAFKRPGNGMAGSGADAFPGERYHVQSGRWRFTVSG